MISGKRTECLFSACESMSWRNGIYLYCFDLWSRSGEGGEQELRSYVRDPLPSEISKLQQERHFYEI